MESALKKWQRVVGVLFVLLYAFGTGFAIYYAVTCGPGLCGLAGVVPFTPWPQLLEGLLGLDLPQISLMLAFLINAVIVYYLGRGLARITQYIFSDNEEEPRVVKL